MSKTDTIVVIGKNETVPVKVVESEGKSIQIIELTPLEAELKDCVVQPIREQYESYQGPYSITPTNAQQVLPTNNKLTTDNIVVEPIPNNYGLISWNGSTLTVS